MCAPRVCARSQADILEEACRAQQEEGSFEVTQGICRPGGGLDGVSAAKGGSEA